ncbi:enoyl-CoA hydratase [Shinella sp. SUS2]|uniref:enoyl-CoA hydratase n=1 Tax=unclassified Shinella TaxID=2643062 RepID=UPI0003C55EF5|nr:MULTISPECIES: enoyl-CoA hydratase [unclassified Shinella]MCA0341195.1 enoyl-CoA hydratase [Pseudomonadota bacterium]EYR81336.1 3-hydroxypropionyl-coenzyme A dehydratase [Shinella sp. DD12]KNY18535.1 enoyl-CoA hydratase [Shinella sp. SUS2]KOC77704.1 enoyl-CoA hydratase [Shinella sp. GWS1]MDG4671596.1 enoyl-CoA hydratase [Shinella sp. 838]
MADVVSFRKEEPAGLVRIERQGPVVRITLNNPPANALSIAVMEALGDALDVVAGDEATRVVVLASTGKVFSAGHDLKEMTARRTDEDGGRAFFEKTMRMAADIMLKIAALPQPVVAEIDGLATAAGCQLVASCDLAICTDTSTFCTPGVNIGLFCSTPMVAVTRAAHPKQAMEMLLTGETIDASTAKDFGLVNRIVPQQYLRQVVDKYAAVIASKSPQALRIGKAAFRAQAGLPLAEAYDVAVAAMADNMLVDDAKEGIGAFLGKRMPEWRQK